MTTTVRLQSLLLVLLTMQLFLGCESDTNDDILVDPTTEFDGELTVFEEGGDNRNLTIDASKISNSNATVKVSFKTSTESMRRLYVTQNFSGFGATPYSFSLAGITVDDKKDGSLDLASDNKNSFEFAIPFPLPTSADSNVTYTIWATTGRGDFRDIDKRNAIGAQAFGTIIISGSGSNSGNGIKTYTDIQLEAPLASGGSLTFKSLFNDQVYKISDGEETAALWDFGYYYGASGKASLASTASYPALFDHDNNSETALVKVSVLTGVPQEDLNTFYIGTSSLNFDLVTSAADLDGITKPSSESVTNLSVDDVLEFQDQYGKKGVILVKQISGTFGTGDFIKIDIKVQL